MHRRRVASLLSAGLIILSLLLTATPVAAWWGHGHRSGAVVRLDGLSSPKALAVGNFFDVYVGQGWAGPPAGPVIKYRTLFNRGARDVSGPLSLTDIAFARDGATWLLGSDGILSRQRHLGGAIDEVLNLHEYQTDDPDPYDPPVPDDPEGPPTETNPNGLAAVGKRSVLVVDAANNDLIRVKPDGTPVTVARWTREEQSTAHLGPGFPPTMPAEAVPTTVVIGPDGWAYVGQLVGFPGTPGAANIWRVNPWDEDAVCSLDPKVARGCSVWKSGFTAIFDIAFNRFTGTLYVYEIAEDGWLAFEEGFTTGEFPPAVLLEVKHHSVRELARGELSQPGGVVVTLFGRVFVTDGMFGDGRLVEIKR